MPEFRDGDVLEYTPHQHWCREGTATVTSYDGRLSAFDTYWQTGSDAHVLDEFELRTAEVQFNLHDFVELSPYSKHAPEEWLRRAPADRAVITSQHGLVTRYYARLGSEPDIDTMRSNLMRKVDDAEAEIATAKTHLSWAERELAEFNEKHPEV